MEALGLTRPELDDLAHVVSPYMMHKSSSAMSIPADAPAAVLILSERTNRPLVGGAILFEIVDRHPIGRGFAILQQPSRGEYQRAGANGCRPGGCFVNGPYPIKCARVFAHGRVDPGRKWTHPGVRRYPR